jgi:hypothetical protein
MKMRMEGYIPTEGEEFKDDSDDEDENKDTSLNNETEKEP